MERIMTDLAPKTPLADVIECDPMPPDKILILAPRYDAAGNLDVQATCKASALIYNVGIAEKEDIG